jgi:uncharacterized protein (TIGR03435 family)
MRRTILAGAIFQVVFQVAFHTGQCFGQTPAPPPAFEVASVKVSKAPPGSDSSHSTLGSISMRNMTLRACIGMAYNVKEPQILSGLKWLDADRYDIDAKSAGAARGPELRVMLQTLLTERFQLALHRETKTFPGYALVVVKAGLKMHAAEPGQSNLSTHNGSMTAEKASMASLATSLSRRLGAPVDDATGVAGVFDFKLELPPQDNHAAAAIGDTAGAEAADPASFVAALSNVLQDRLGLKLDARKIPQEVLVIDHAEKPPEN